MEEVTMAELLEPGILKGVSTTTITKLRRTGYTILEVVAARAGCS